MVVMQVICIAMLLVGTFEVLLNNVIGITSLSLAYCYIPVSLR